MRMMRRTRVLLAEDDADTREMATMVLRMIGFEVVQAADGLAALAAIHQEHVDVVLLDLSMPAYDGNYFLDNYRGPVPVVVFTAWGPRHVRLPRPPFAVVTKPKTMAEIAPLLQRAAESWRQ